MNQISETSGIYGAYLPSNTANKKPDETGKQLKYTPDNSEKISKDKSLNQRTIDELGTNNSQTDFRVADHNGVTVAMKIAAQGNVENFKALLEENRNASPEKAIDFEQTNKVKKNLIDLILFYEQNEILDVLIDYFNSCEETESYLGNIEFFLKIIASDLESSDKKLAITKFSTINTELTEEQKNTFEPLYKKLISGMIEVADDIETIKTLYSVIKQLKPDDKYLKEQEVTNTKTLIAMQAGLAGNIEVLKFLISDNEIQALNEIQDVNKRDILMRLILSDIPDKITIFNNLMEYSQTFNPRERRHFVINHRDKDSNTLAMYAAEKNDRDIIHALVKKYGISNILYVTNNQDKNAIDFSNEAGHTELFTEVLQVQAELVKSREKSPEDREAEIERVRRELGISSSGFRMSSDQMLERDTNLAIEQSLLQN